MLLLEQSSLLLSAFSAFSAVKEAGIRLFTIATGRGRLIPATRQPGPPSQCGQEKVVILWQHLVEKVPVSEVCEVIGELMEDHVRLKKKSWGGLNGGWTQPDVRDEVIDYVRSWSDKTELPARTLVGWIGIGRAKYYQWKDRYGQVNEHNAWPA